MWLYNAVPIFHGHNDYNGYEDCESYLDHFFCFFSLTTEQKYYYSQLKLIGEVSAWYLSKYKFRLTWYMLQLHVRAWKCFTSYLQLFTKYFKGNNTLKCERHEHSSRQCPSINCSACEEFCSMCICASQRAHISTCPLLRFKLYWDQI